jgi:hypothetical protein
LQLPEQWLYGSRALPDRLQQTDRKCPAQHRRCL